MTATRLLVAVAAVLATLLTARLGWWQVERGRAKQALADSITERMALAPLSQLDLASSPRDATDQHHRRISVRGQWLTERTVYLDNRQMKGRPGFYVLTPLRLADGSAVLVQRGWQPRDLMDRTRVVPPSAVSGSVRFEARVAPPPARLFEFEGADQGPIRQNLEMDAFSREVGVTLRPLSLLQLSAARVSAGATEATDATASDCPDAPAVDDGLLREWPLPAAQVDKHWGYAFQWFSLSALIAGLFVWFQILKPRRLRHAA